MCMYAWRFQIRAYMHRHNLYNHKKNGWLAASPEKIYILQCDFIEIVRVSMSSKRKVFYETPTTTVEKYFVVDSIIDWYGNEGLGIIGTNVSNRLPKDIEPFYLHN